MSIHEAELIEYCLGTLDPEKVRQLEQARDDDPAVAHALAEIAETLGVLGDVSPRLTPRTGLRERVAGSVTPTGRLDGFATRLARLFAIDLDKARDMLANAAKAPAAPWIETPVPGTFLLRADRGAVQSAARCALVYLERGATIPRHRHRGAEHMLILDGYAEEDTGRMVGPGDEVSSDAGTEHEFKIVADTPCLIAVSIERGLDWIRWQDRAVFACKSILNRLLGRA